MRNVALMRMSSIAIEKLENIKGNPLFPYSSKKPLQWGGLDVFGIIVFSL
jgi:hypothetical protein